MGAKVWRSAHAGRYGLAQQFRQAVPNQSFDIVHRQDPSLAGVIAGADIENRLASLRECDAKEPGVLWFGLVRAGELTKRIAHLGNGLF